MAAFTMKRRRLSQLLCVLAIAKLATTQQTTCPDGSTGYGDILGLNTDIQTEVQRIQRGGVPKMLYLYRLCPGVEIAMTEPLVPQLDGSVFRCGDSGLPSEECLFRGGERQVIISSSEIPMQDVRFEGVTFTGFSVAAISGNATEQTTVTLEDAQFMTFDATFAVHQSNPVQDAKPFSVDMFGGMVAGAGGMGSVFSNDGGTLTIEQVTVIESNDVMALVATGGQGATLARDVTVSGGTIGDVFSVVGGSTLMATGISIQDMNFIQNGFVIEGQNSRATIRSTNFMGNKRLPPAQKWHGVAVREGGEAVVSSSAFVHNHQMLAVLSAVGVDAVLNVDDVSIESVSGSTADDKATAAGVVYANAHGHITLSRLTVNHVRAFTSIIFSNQGSSIQISQSCFEAGKVDAIAYQSEESTIRMFANFVDDRALTSGICQATGLRGVVEKPGSNCFEGGTPCEWTCARFADAGECLAQLSLQPGFQGPFNNTGTNGTATLPPIGSVNGTATPPPSEDGAETGTPLPGNVTAPPVIAGNATGPPGNVTTTTVPTPSQITAPPGTLPTLQPSSDSPSVNDTIVPSVAPGGNGTTATSIPSISPGNVTIPPTLAPVGNLTVPPGGNVTISPTFAPGITPVPGGNLTITPSIAPGGNVTTSPTLAPGLDTGPPTGNFTVTPTFAPGNATSAPGNGTIVPGNTTVPTFSPTTAAPTNVPTTSPAPTVTPNPTPSEPTLSPVVPSASPSSSPTITPVPSASPSARPSASPTISPQPTISVQPSASPTVSPAPTTEAPSASPSSSPSASPSSSPSTTPPSPVPSSSPSVAPSAQPSSSPSSAPSVSPTISPMPSASPSSEPSSSPSSVVPSFRPSPAPTANIITAPPVGGPAPPPNNCDCRNYWYQREPTTTYYPPPQQGKGAGYYPPPPPPPPQGKGAGYYPPPPLPPHHYPGRRQRRRTRAWSQNRETDHYRLQVGSATDHQDRSMRRLKGSKGSSGKGKGGKGQPWYPPPPPPPVPSPGGKGINDPCYYYCKWLLLQGNPSVPGVAPARPPHGGFRGRQSGGDTDFFS